MKMTKDLYTSKEISEVRKLLYEEQQGVCKLTGIAFALNNLHTDHVHDEEQFIRGAIYGPANRSLGKLENIWTRYLSYWYPGTLSDFLRQAASYIELEPDTRFRHNGWIKRIKTKFNSLNASQMQEVLKRFGKNTGKNAVERKEIFGEIVLDRSIGYDKLREVISEVKQPKGEL